MTSYAGIPCSRCDGIYEACTHNAAVARASWNAGCDVHYQQCLDNQGANCEAEQNSCIATGTTTYLNEIQTCLNREINCSLTCVSPIIINLEPGRFALTGLDDPVQFDIDADGEPETLSWTDPDSACAFLVLDRNGNGTIDDGTELFGEHTPQPASEEPNGFVALGFYDRAESGGNEDGVISASDSIFPLLRLWTDGNHDGVSQSSELAPLEASQVRGVSLDYIESRRQDRHGNWFRWASMVDFDNRRRMAAVDVFFVVDD